MSVAENFKSRSRRIVKKVLSVVCSITIGMAALTAVPTKSEAAIAVSGNDIIRTAVPYLGTPYVWGGTSKDGVDCSGFVYLVLTQLGYRNVPRSSAAWHSTPALTWNGESVNVQTLDPTNPSYDAQPGDILVYQGHVAISMGRPGTWGSYSDIRSYTAAMGGNTNLVFDTSSSWPNTSPWYRIHARSVAARGRIQGVEIDDTNFAAAGCYAIKAYRITGNMEHGGNSSPGSSSNSNASSGAPSIVSVQFSDISTAGYTVTAKFANAASIASLSFPTWTSINGQDDITWDSVNLNGDTAIYRVNTSNHKRESGEYNTHIHMRDRFGNLTIGGGNVQVPSSTANYQKPKVTSFHISNVSASGYDVTITFENADSIQYVSCPTWTDVNGQDDITWGRASSSGNTYTYRVHTSEHGGQRGRYYTHAHIYDKSGNLLIDGREVIVP